MTVYVLLQHFKDDNSFVVKVSDDIDVITILKEGLEKQDEIYVTKKHKRKYGAINEEVFDLDMEEQGWYEISIETFTSNLELAFSQGS
jgi:hypothetical protein